jgi:DedD protein
VSPQRRAETSRLGTALFALGCLTVLGLVFASGLYAGRSWPAFLTWVGPRARAEAPKVGAEKRPPPPVLTFYDELAAPLTPSPTAPPRPKPAKAPPKAEATPSPAAVMPLAPSGPAAETAAASRAADSAPAAPVAVAASAPSLPPRTSDPAAAPAPATRGPAGDPGVRFTIQVGAFTARGPADALKARLTAAGHAAYVTAVDAPSGPRYRVRVGTYPTREEARQVARALAAERHVPTSYVTTR